MDIRYGRLSNGRGEPEWFGIPHVECDGIGGFARLLREHGIAVPQLPQAKPQGGSTIGSLWRFWRNSRHSSTTATRNDWCDTKAATGVPDIAWHVFGTQETKAIIDACRRQQITVNSLLLQCLDAAVRPKLGIHDVGIPWMIPVNMRGQVKYPDDTENHVSCVDLIVSPHDTLTSLHQQMTTRLERGEHLANFTLMNLGRFFSHRLKQRLLVRSRSKIEGNIGAFSNLGSWSPELSSDTDEAWLFCPPMVTGQRLAAGCVTFHHRLSLMLQTRTSATISDDLAQRWVTRWQEHIIDACGIQRPVA